MEDEQLQPRKNRPTDAAIAEVLARREQWIKEAVAKELAERRDLLPPWLKFPDIPNFSIGWRMGGGESYIMMWQAWAKGLNQSQLLEYFTQYKPIPVDWLNWVSYFFGFDEDIFSDTKDFPGIHYRGFSLFLSFPLWPLCSLWLFLFSFRISFCPARGYDMERR